MGAALQGLWDRINEYTMLNISHSLLISQVHCSAFPIFNCSMQFHFSVTQRELTAIMVNTSLWHKLPVHQVAEIFPQKQSSTTGIYASPTLESNLVFGWSWGEDRDVICEVCTTLSKENKIWDERPAAELPKWQCASYTG